MKPSQRSFASASGAQKTWSGSFGTPWTGAAALPAIVDGRLSGILAVKTKNRTFYDLGIRSLLTTFGPLKTMRVLFNLGLLSLEDSVKANEFKVETIAVSPDFRGMGIGSALMMKAEEQARSLGHAEDDTRRDLREHGRHTPLRAAGVQDYPYRKGLPRQVGRQVGCGAPYGKAPGRRLICSSPDSS